MKHANIIKCLIWRLQALLNLGPRIDLPEQLKNARIEVIDRLHYYISRQTIDGLINESTITRVLAQHITNPMTLRRTIETTYKSGRFLFGILVLLGKEAEIERFFKEGIFDDQLPLQQCDKDNKSSLHTDNGKLVTATKLWTSEHRENFNSLQWYFLVPVFKNLKHYELHRNSPLPTMPFLPEDGHLEQMAGGFSHVFFLRLHPAHVECSEVVGPKSKGILCAVKCLEESDKAEFERERQILLRLTPKGHPHLVKLLSTFRRDGKLHLIFPFADSDLRAYWDRCGIPDFDRDTILWSLKQMAGIASALARIHELKITIDITDHDQMDVPNGTTGSMKKYKTLYGRHGDIKPENLLWFLRVIGVSDPMGVLQLADFGLGELNDQHSQEHNADDIACSPTYEPPEYRIGNLVSQAYDMWSLGCVLLEFVTWLVFGAQEIYNFSDLRGEISARTGIDDDNFYTITSDTTAIVRPAVLDWVDQLRHHKRCSQLIHDLLDLITKHLIVVEPTERIDSKTLYQWLNKMLDDANMDDDYALLPMST